MALLNDSHFSKTVIEQVLVQEANDGRFEAFANAVVSLMEGGAPVVGTSRSWDQTRDGKALGRASGIFVCSSITGDVDGKILFDLSRIVKTTKIDRLYFCLSHPVSEYMGDKFARQILEDVDRDFPITVIGGHQIAEFVQKHSELCERFYSAEINDILRVLKAPPDEAIEIRGLRLALMSSTGEDSETIRQGVYNAAILDAFAKHPTLTVLGCANAVAASLGIHRAIAPETIRRHLSQLVKERMLEESSGVFSMTEKGRQDVVSRTDKAVERFVALKAQIRRELETAVETPIVDEEFHRIWIALEESMARYFHTQGEEIVAELSELLGDATNGTLSSEGLFEPLSFVDELAKKVASAATGAERAQIIETAIRDIFAAPDGPATTWLLQIASAFISACAIGLEDSSGQAIESLLGKSVLVLDTDVLLSFVGTDEHDHQGVKSLIERWKRLPGKVMVAKPVLEEFSRHAYIAQYEWQQVYPHHIPGNQETRSRLMRNVFVRSFGRMIEEKKARARDWSGYIQTYRGSAEYDYQKAIQTLRLDSKIEELPPIGQGEEALEREVRKFLISRIDESWGPKLYARDKARRDAQLYAAIVHFTRMRREYDPLASCILVSSARRLASAEDEFHQVGDSHMVASISSMLYLISLLPGVSLGLSAMRAFLFEGGRVGVSSDLEQTVLRVIRTSQERNMKFAQRGVLMNSLRQMLLKDAHEMGQRGPEDLLIQRAEKAALETPSNQARLLEHLAGALDQIGPSHRVARENEELKRRQRELEIENERLRRAGGKPRS